jgi:hypothetical protein
MNSPLPASFHSHREKIKAWPVSEPRYGYATAEWMISMSDGSVERFASRFDALCFVNDHGAPDLKAQLAASLRETQERTAYQFEAEDNDRIYAVDPDEVD